MYNLKITVKNVEYPYFETMGACLAFKEMSGLEPFEVSATDQKANLQYMYCVTKLAARHDDVEFSLTFEEFVDGLKAEEYIRIIQAVNSSAQEGDIPKK